MSISADICPTCGRKIRRWDKLLVPAIIGAFVGLGVGVWFVSWWFGTEAGFFHFMAIIHEIAGTVLGTLGGLIVGSLRR